jgi:hypothetical protein
MADPSGGRMPEVTMDADALYREEIYTDRSAGTMRVLNPVTRNGAPDPARPTLYVGEAQLMTNMGPLPIAFEIDAANFGDAVARYGAAAKEGIERTMRELQELRRQSQSSLIVPGAGGGLPGGLPPGGLTGGGLKLP